MSPSLPTRPAPVRRPPASRASVLITAMLLAVIIGISLTSYIQVCTGSLKLSHRSFFATGASNINEGGLEEAVWCFNQMGTAASQGTGLAAAAAAAWSAWTTNTSTHVATFKLPTFNLDQNATGVVKVYVNGYDGTVYNPVVVAQATITPFDGSAPIVKTIELTLEQVGPFANGVVAKSGITWNGHPTANSFVSTTDIATGPYTAYPGLDGARDNTTVAALSGSIGLGAQGVVDGNVELGTGVTESGGSITGSVIPNFNRPMSMPVYPTTASVSNSYNLGSTVPAILPRVGDTPASDGKYYYFVSNTAISTTTITAGNNVTVVGTTTSVLAGLTVQPTANLILYIDGPVTASGNGAINNGSWAGALQIFTSTSAGCSIGGNGIITACLFAPNAPLTVNGGGSSGQLIGSFVANTITSNGHMDFHWDEGLAYETNKPWGISIWRELQSASERATYTSQLNF